MKDVKSNADAYTCDGDIEKNKQNPLSIGQKKSIGGERKN